MEFLPLFKTKEVAFAALVFILISSIYYFNSNFLIFLKIVKKIIQSTQEDLKEISKKIEKAEFPEFHNFYKLFLVISVLGLIVSLIPIFSMTEHKNATMWLLVTSTLIVIEVIIQYLIVIKKREKTNKTIKDVYRGLIHLKTSSFSGINLKDISKLKISDQLKLVTSFSMIIISMLLWTMPSLLTMGIASYLILCYYNLLENSLLLVFLVTFLLLILIYPVRKYFETKIHINLLEIKEKALLDLRKEVILNNRKTLKTHLESYKKYLEELGYFFD